LKIELPSKSIQCPVKIQRTTTKHEKISEINSAGSYRPQHPSEILKMKNSNGALKFIYTLIPYIDART